MQYVLARVQGTIVLLVLSASLWLSFHWMVGDFYGERVALSLDTWIQKNTSPPQSALKQHLQFSEAAVKWAPASPRYPELKARLLTMNLVHLATTQEVMQAVDDIIELHRTAAADRPRWSISWANLAYMKSLKRIYDDEYQSAVNHAVTFGPYEVAALYKVIMSGVFLWAELSDMEKQLMSNAVANAIHIRPGFLNVIRPVLSENGLLFEVCERATFQSAGARQQLCNYVRSLD